MDCTYYCLYTLNHFILETTLIMKMCTWDIAKRIMFSDIAVCVLLDQSKNLWHIAD